MQSTSKSSSSAKEISYTVPFSGTVAEAVEVLTNELKQRGFGVLASIDVRKLIKEKLGEHMDSFVILDICSPRHAKKALDAHKEVGLILPCKATVYEDNGKVYVSLFKPTSAINILGFEDLNSLAMTVEKELGGALDAISA